MNSLTVLLDRTPHFLQSYLKGGFESTVVCDVLPQSLFSIQWFLVDGVVTVLIHHALSLLLEGLHRGVLPPGMHVSIFVKLPPCLDNMLVTFYLQFLFFLVWHKIFIKMNVSKIKKRTNLGRQTHASTRVP